ncbi:hypothetical protein ACN28S_36510 [Cystobacter fuscus]
MAELGFESATVYVVDFLEPGTVVTRPVRISRAEFQQAFLRLSHDVRLGTKTPQEAARQLLHLLPPPEGVETVDSRGDWLLEVYRDQAYTLVPERQEGPVVLTPAADEALRAGTSSGVCPEEEATAWVSSTTGPTCARTTGGRSPWPWPLATCSTRRATPWRASYWTCGCSSPRWSGR